MNRNEQMKIAISQNAPQRHKKKRYSSTDHSEILLPERVKSLPFSCCCRNFSTLLPWAQKTDSYTDKELNFFPVVPSRISTFAMLCAKNDKRPL